MRIKRTLAAALAWTLLTAGSAYAYDESFDLTSGGCVFDFSQPLTDGEVRIICHDYVDLYFNGHYGTDRENLRVWTEPLEKVTDALGDEDLNFYIFGAEPKFAKEVKVAIDGDAGSFLYEYRDEEIRRVDAVYESDAWTFQTKKLGAYFLAEEEYPDGPLGAVAQPPAEEGEE